MSARSVHEILTLTIWLICIVQLQLGPDMSCVFHDFSVLRSQLSVAAVESYGVVSQANIFMSSLCCSLPDAHFLRRSRFHERQSHGSVRFLCSVDKEQEA
jgi:hypothetical protein